MLYALLTTISTLIPTATPMPTPTATPLPVFVSIVENTADKPGLWEIVGILSSVILGVVALIISINAYKFAKKQQKREEEMRQREAKIAVMDKAFDVYNYFINDVLKDNLLKEEPMFDASKHPFFPKRSETYIKENNIKYLSHLIFNDETCNRIHKVFSFISEARYHFYSARTSPSYDKYIESFKNLANVYGINVPDNITEHSNTDDYMLSLLHDYLGKEVNSIFEKYRLIM